MVKLTVGELSRYDGKQEEKILISIRTKIYDVTSGATHYGEGGSYQKFAGKDVTRALATMLITDESINDVNFTTDGNPKHEKTLTDWETKLGEKYPIYGTLIVTEEDKQNSVKKAELAKTEQKETKEKEEGERECPWPFILLHDPMTGLGSKYLMNNLAVFALFAATFVGMMVDPEVEVNANEPKACPWPYIFFHDPVKAVAVKFLGKNLCVVATITGLIAAFKR